MPGASRRPLTAPEHLLLAMLQGAA